MPIATSMSTATTVASVESKRLIKTGIRNPFLHKHMRFNEDDWDQQSFDTQTSSSSLFSKESGSSSKLTASTMTSTTTPSNISQDRMRVATRMMIPMNLLEAELDLEADERRCLEERSLSMQSWEYSRLPRYEDHVLALRILVECLAKLGRLDDVERTLHENLEQEIRKLAQTEQARTFMRLERGTRGKRGIQDMKDFRRHLKGMLSAFGCVMIRLSHLAQILRHRIVSCVCSTTTAGSKSCDDDL